MTASADDARESSLFGSGRFRLRPLTLADADFVFEQEVSEQLTFRWRHSGAHPDPYTYGQSLWDGVLASFLAVDNDGTRVGLFTIYAADMRNRFAYVAAALFEDAPKNSLQRGALAVEAMSRLIEYSFRGWDFRKLYLDVAEYNLPQFQSMVGRVAVEEGRLRSHVFLEWNWWDVVTLSIWRDTWEKSSLRSRYGLTEGLPAGREQATGSSD